MKKIVLNKFNTGVLKEELISRNDSPVYAGALQYSDNFIINNTGQIKFRPGFEFLFPTYKNKKAWYLSFKNILFEMTDKNIRAIKLDELNSENLNDKPPFGYSFFATVSNVVISGGTAKVTLINVSGNFSLFKVGMEVLIRLNTFTNNADYSPSHSIDNYTILSIDSAVAPYQMTLNIIDKNIIIPNSLMVLAYSIIDSSAPNDFPYTEEQLATISNVKIDDGILIAHPAYNIKYIKYDATTQTISSKDYLTSQSTFPAPVSGITLYEGRLYCVGKSWIWASKVGDFKDFAFGNDDTAAFKNNIANTNREEPHEFYWILGTNKALYAGSLYGVIQITGANIEASISAKSFNSKPVGNINSSNIQALHYLDYIVYSTGSQNSLRLIDYAPFGEGSRNIPVTEFTDLFLQKKVISMVLLRADNNYILALTEIGELIYGFIEFGQNGIYGAWVIWSLENSKITSIYTVGDNMVFASVEVNGLCYTEKLTNLKLMPNQFNYQVSNDHKADKEHFIEDLLIANKQNNFLDSSITFDTFKITKLLGASLQIVSSNTATITISLFNSSWLLTPISLKQTNGLNIIIQPTIIVSDKQIRFVVLSQNKPGIESYPSGNWARGTKNITNLPINNVDLTLIADNGDYYEAINVTDRSIHLNNDFIFKAYIGIKYIGRLVTIPFSSLDEKKNIAEIKFELLNSHRFLVGRDFYNMTRISLTQQLKISGQPFIPYTGNYSLRIDNLNWFKKSGICIMHDRPNAMNILHIAVYYQEN